MTVTLPPFAQRMKTAIETELDFRVLANGGEARLFQWARDNGLRGPSLVLQWQANYNRAHGDGAPPAAPKGARPARIETDDLDFWADGDQPVDDDDLPNEDEPGQLWRVCPSCRGLGFDSTGGRCQPCGGMGRIEVDDVEDEDNEEGAHSFYGRIEDEE